MATTDTTTRTALLVTLGHRVIQTHDEALMNLTDGSVIVTVTPTTEHAYFVRRYVGEGAIFIKDDSATRWQSFVPAWHLPAVIVFEPSNTD